MEQLRDVPLGTFPEYMRDIAEMSQSYLCTDSTLWDIKGTHPGYPCVVRR